MRRAASSCGGPRSKRVADWERRSLVDRNVVGRRLLVLSETVQHIERESPGDAQALAGNPVLRAAIERWIQVAIEACIDVAYHVIADRGWIPPDSARGAFAVLAAHGLLDVGLAARLGGAASLRNILVHEYVAIDLDKLSDAIRRDLGDLKVFGAIAARWLEEDP